MLKDMKKCNLTMKKKVKIKRGRGMAPLIKWEDYHPDQDNQQYSPVRVYETSRTKKKLS